MVLVIDYASYHRTRQTLELLEAHADHVFVIWLPRYRPELNLIEGLWGYLKRSALNNYFCGDMSLVAGRSNPSRVSGPSATAKHNAGTQLSHRY